MKKLLMLLLPVFILSLSVNTSYAQWGWGTKGEGPVVKKDLKIADFHALNLSISADVYLKKGSKQSVTVEGQENIIDLIKTEVRDGKWNISFEKSVNNYKSPLKIYITVDELSYVGVSGSGSISSPSAFQYKGEFGVRVSGSGDVKLEIEAPSIMAKISGSGEISLAGTTEKLDIRISGSGDLNAYNLKAESCVASISGSGDCEVYATENLRASISGSGDVSYKGSPKVQTKISGSGDLHSRS